ncbi:hypothetical protein BJV78DRAFT_1196813 [Lactifluus subvellereus]|nr:hypothetical protein BJV78DRAFT_1196813 [Lactifluus subvellereus]
MATWPHDHHSWQHTAQGSRPTPGMHTERSDETPDPHSEKVPGNPFEVDFHGPYNRLLYTLFPPPTSSGSRDARG